MAAQQPGQHLLVNPGFGTRPVTRSLDPPGALPRRGNLPSPSQAHAEALGQLDQAALAVVIGLQKLLPQIIRRRARACPELVEGAPAPHESLAYSTASFSITTFRCAATSLCRGLAHPLPDTDKPRLPHPFSRSLRKRVGKFIRHIESAVTSHTIPVCPTEFGVTVRIELRCDAPPLPTLAKNARMGQPWF